MTDNSLPAPLVAAEVNLQDFADMMLDARKLRDSRFAASVSGDAFRAGVLLWCAAWHQVPCGSLPDDDIELANLAGYGRFVKEWKKSRDEALMGFIKCSDGRLYHKTVCEKANAAWIKRLEHYYERAKDRLRKVNKERGGKQLPLLAELTFDQWNERRLSAGIPMEKADASDGIPPTPPPPKPGIPPENALKGEGEGEGTERESIKTPAPPPEPSAAVAARVDLVARFKAAGIHPSEVAYLDQLVDAGVGWDEIAGFLPQALKASKPLRYVVGAVIGERERAAQRVIPPRPEGQPAPESFRERDERLATERAAAFMGRPLNPQPDAGAQRDVIDVESRDVTPPALGR